MENKDDVFSNIDSHFKYHLTDPTHSLYVVDELAMKKCLQQVSAILERKKIEVVVQQLLTSKRVGG